MKPFRFALAPALMLAAACGGASLKDGRTATGSQVMATSSDRKALYVANADDGTISRVDVTSRNVTKIAVGQEPTRVTRAGNRVLVTLRAERKIAVLSEGAEGLTLSETKQTGAEPVGIVADEAGTRVYVAASTSGVVEERDAATLEVLRTFEVEGEPRWLALHPSGKSLYVASVVGGKVTWIDLDSGKITPIEIPRQQGFDSFKGGGAVTLATRLTGDPAVTPDGEQLLVPGFLADNESVVVERPADEGGFVPPGRGGGGYDQGGFTPVMIAIPLDGSGEPAVADVELISVAGFTDQPVRSYPTSVTVSPDGELALVTMEGSAAVTAVVLADPSPPRGDLFDLRSGAEEAPGLRGGPALSSRATAAIQTDAGPNGVVFLDDDRSWVYGFLDRTAAELPFARVRGDLTRPSGSSGDVVSSGGASIAIDARAPFPGGFSNYSAKGGVRVASGNLTPEVEYGRKLFFSAIDSRVSGTGVGLSCATCHFQGRTDGLTWTFDRGGLQTPSLAGKVSLTAPVRWEGDRETVAVDAMRTSQGLMGGVGLVDSDAKALEAFIDSTRDVDSPLKGSNDPAVARGKEIFERPAVGCANCHNGERYTNGEKYNMFGKQDVKTRSLVGVAASAPYLHDGSARTLDDVLARARNGAMGDTSSLSSAELSDLKAYLRSL